MTTRVSLLTRLRERDDPEAWRGLEAMYRPMLLRLCRARGLQPADAEDVVQSVFVGLVRGLRTFEYDPARGRFRDYLGRSLANAMADWAARRRRDHENRAARSHALVGLNHLEPLEAAFEREWVNHHYQAAIETVLATIDPRSMEVFREAMRGLSPAEIAVAAGMTEAAVYKSLSRTRQRLRDVIAEQLRREDAEHG